MELSECVTKFRGHYGWTHRDIIKLSHPKSANVGNDSLCYKIAVVIFVIVVFVYLSNVGPNWVA
jgi:hypothetical protein